MSQPDGCSAVSDMYESDSAIVTARQDLKSQKRQALFRAVLEQQVTGKTLTLERVANIIVSLSK